jgi:predicted branched-subunit amino acid permease
VPRPPRPHDADRAKAVRAGLGVGLATAAYGVSFGALATLSGLDVWQTCFLSLILFSGGSQFALIGVLGAGGVAAAGPAIGSAVLLGSRNLFYAVRMSPLLPGGILRRVAAAQLTIDESTAVAVTQDEPAEQRRGFWITGAVIFLGWNLTTFIGALAGDALGDPKQYGLDAAAAGAFLGLLWPRLSTREPVAVAVGAAFVAAVLVPVVPAGIPVVAAAVVAVVAGLARR